MISRRREREHHNDTECLTTSTRCVNKAEDLYGCERTQTLTSTSDKNTNNKYKASQTKAQ